MAGLDVRSPLGALRHIDDAKRAEALSLVRAGRLYDLGRELHEGIPAFPGRHSARRSSPTPGRGWGTTTSTGRTRSSARRCRSARTSTLCATCAWATAPTTGG